MKKILLAGFKHETNTFVTSSVTSFESYRQRVFEEGEGIISRFTGTKTECGGMIDVAAARGLELHPVVMLDAQPGPKVDRAVFDFARDKILSALRSGSYDGVLLVLHGAAVITDLEDGEGELLEAIRGAYPEGPVIATLDMHANLTAKMAENATALFAYDTYPHVDFYDRGAEAASCMADILEGRIRARLDYVKLPMISAGMPTLFGVVKNPRLKSQALS